MLRRLATSVVHQLFCPYMLVMVTGDLVFTVVGFVRGTPHTASRILTMNPFYPCQIGVGLAAGYYVGRFREWWFARWTWIVPAIILLSTLTFTPGPDGLSRAGYFFGWSGLPKQGMVPAQLAVTMPFYLSAAYSLSAWMGIRDKRRKHTGTTATAA